MLGVMTLPAVRDTAADGRLDGFEVGYVAEDGTQHRLPLTDVWAVRFEVMAPVRRFASRKGQRPLPGRWWSATDGGHVGYESWLERDHVMALDFDATVVGIASQPFWLSWTCPLGLNSLGAQPISGVEVNQPRMLGPDLPE
jgi:hypothetical protein